MNGHKRSHIAARRYVDDLMCISYAMCSLCLYNTMMTAYKGLISFDLDDDAVKQLGKNTMIKVLDFVVVTSPIKTTIFQK